jgi:hypothetical protein
MEIGQKVSVEAADIQKTIGAEVGEIVDDSPVNLEYDLVIEVENREGDLRHVGVNRDEISDSIMERDVFEDMRLYELNGCPIGLAKFFELNDFSKEEQEEILEMEEGDVKTFGGQGCMKLERTQ